MKKRICAMFMLVCILLVACSTAWAVTIDTSFSNYTTTHQSGSAIKSNVTNKWHMKINDSKSNVSTTYVWGGRARIDNTSTGSVSSYWTWSRQGVDDDYSYTKSVGNSTPVYFLSKMDDSSTATSGLIVYATFTP